MASVVIPSVLRAAARQPAAPVRSSEESQLWLSIGGPIVGLIALTAVSALFLLANIARGQDRAYEVAEAQLVGRTLEGVGESVSATAKDFGIWNDAYRNISVRWNSAWVAENATSAAVDGLVIFRADGSIRHAWTADEFAEHSGALTAAAAIATHPDRLARIAQAQTTDIMVARNYLEIDGLLVAVATVPVRPENSGAPTRMSMSRATNYVAAIEVIDQARIEKIGQSLGVRDLRFQAGGAPPARVDGTLNLIVPNHDEALIGWLAFSVDKPGSRAFARRAVTIAAGLLLFGLLAFLVSRSLVERQMRVMAEARHAAEDANRVKSQFFANMSHELRTPLNAVIGYAELLEEDAAAAGRPRQGEDSRRIGSAARHLLGLINDILEHSKFEAAAVEVYPEHVELSRLIDEVVDLVRVAAERNNVLLKVACAPDLTAYVDRMRLKQCLVNLAGNAVKFTKDGRVSIAAHATTVNGAAMVAFDVVDTGIGMSPEDLGDLFQPFVQAHGARNRQFGGTGLGLSITKRLAEAMGGTVTVRSAPGAGSTFTLTVARAQPATAGAG